MEPKLYMLLLGATPKGRLTEQHDVFFGIANSLAGPVPQIKSFWPEANGKIHIDSWREVTLVDGYQVDIIPGKNRKGDLNLFFLNLGGYKPNDLEEYHYKILAVTATMADAVKQSKTTAFYKHYGFKGAQSHIDEKFGIDVDDAYKVGDILDEPTKRRFSLQITKSDRTVEDELHTGYLKIEKLQNTISV